MADITSGRISIEAPLAVVRELLFNIAEYPTWSSAIKSVEVLGKDDSGRVTTAKLQVDAGVLKDRVTLDYDWSDFPEKLTFSLQDADLLTSMDGAYIIAAQDEDTTDVTYELNVDLSMPIPAMMRHKAEKATIEMALHQLKSAAEKVES